MAPVDVIIQQMPHLSKDLTPVCSLHPRGVAPPPEGKQNKKRVRMVGDSQVNPSLFTPGPVLVARGGPDGARIWARPHLSTTGEEDRFWKEAGGSLDPGSDSY